VSVDDAPEDDVALLRQAARGDVAAFEPFVARYDASVHRFIRTLTGDPAAAEDALQETFLAAWRGAGAFRGDASVRSWLFTIARHAVYRQFRQRAGAPHPEEMTSLDDLGVRAGWGSADPEALAIARQRHDAVQRALDRLAPDDRRVLLLRDVEQLSGEDAASVLGLTLPALKSRLHRARLRFTASLREEVLDGV
jgi:RNA polymerase sigma-70 factor (ECF subfamily)